MIEMAAQTLYEAVLAKVQVGSKGVRPTARKVVFSGIWRWKSLNFNRFALDNFPELR
jgi:hypothetical protein